MLEITNYHIKRQKGKIFKVLPLFEEKNEGVTTYIASLIYELEGFSERLDEKQNSMLQSIVDILENLYNDSLAPEPDLTVIKREVFNCVNLFAKMLPEGDE